MEKLTPKQQAFCDYYIETGNATESYKRAGYIAKRNAAEVNASRLLSNAKVQDHLAERMAEKDAKRIATQDEVLEHLTRVMRREEKDYTVVTLKTKRVWYEEGKRHEEESERAEVVELPTRVSDTNKAAELLGKRHMLWVERQSVDANHTVTFVEDLDE